MLVVLDQLVVTQQGAFLPMLRIRSRACTSALFTTRMICWHIGNLHWSCSCIVTQAGRGGGAARAHTAGGGGGVRGSAGGRELPATDRVCAQQPRQPRRAAEAEGKGAGAGFKGGGADAAVPLGCVIAGRPLQVCISAKFASNARRSNIAGGGSDSGAADPPMLPCHWDATSAGGPLEV